MPGGKGDRLTLGFPSLDNRHFSRDFVTLKSDKIKTLYLQGLTTEFEEIFKEYGLKSEEKWTKLRELYQGHPNWLNIISSTIIELFDGEVSLFLPFLNLQKLIMQEV